jgi:CspA family cold shock protein
MVDGTVKIYSNSWKFGFIAKDEGGQVFFHASSVMGKDVRKDDVVEFDIDNSPRGPRAVNVRKVVLKGARKLGEF